jgi:hypothetical protein
MFTMGWMGEAFAPSLMIVLVAFVRQAQVWHPGERRLPDIESVTSDSCCRLQLLRLRHVCQVEAAELRLCINNRLP